MPIICPSITATNSAQFTKQIQNVESFAGRIHIDCMDGQFAPVLSIPPAQAWWPLGMIADMHLMFAKPLEQLETIISLGPHLVIIHAEAEQASEFITEITNLGIKTGLALLQTTHPESCQELLTKVDHILIFSGNLGHYGGTAELKLLNKVAIIKKINPKLEIGWDGGINLDNAKQLIDGGIDVLNVGGFIQNAINPRVAFTEIEKVL